MQETTRQQYLQAMDIQLWENRLSLDIAGLDVCVEQNKDRDPLLKVDHDTEELDWQSLQRKVESCVDCHLHENRIYPVLGAGDLNARVMFIGEAPGADEDRLGEPFVGPAGQLLNEMLQAVGFKREQVYIANTLKCRPPGDRTPESIEIEMCEKYLTRQISLIQPDLIVALGEVSAQWLLKSDDALREVRGRIFHEEKTGAPVIVTYHPAYLLKKPLEKCKSWDDLKLILSQIEKIKD